MKNVANKFFNETIAALVIGGVPCVILVYKYSVEFLFSYIHSLIPPYEVIYYFAGITVLHILIWANKKYILRKTEKSKRIVKTLHSISYNVGFTLTGLYRVIAGVLLVVITPILYVEPVAKNAFVISYGYLFAFSSILMCCILSSIQDETAPRPTIF